MKRFIPFIAAVLFTTSAFAAVELVPKQTKFTAADYTVLTTDDVVKIQTTPLTITLPAASSVATTHPIVLEDVSGFYRYDTTSSAHPLYITVTPNGSDTIDGVASLKFQGKVTLFSDGVSRWRTDYGVDCQVVTPQSLGSVLTAGTMTASNVGELRYTWSKYQWTNAMVVALGANLTGDITVCTLPAKTIVRRAMVVIDTPDTSSNNLTVALGTAATGYIDFVVASNAKATAGTVYGDAFAEMGTNLSHIVNTTEQTPADFIGSWTTTTAVKAHFIKSTTNLDTVTGSTGSIYLETALLP